MIGQAFRALKRVARSKIRAARFKLFFLMHVVLPKPLHTFGRHALFGGRRRAMRIVCFVGGLWLASAIPARAEFEVCNQTLDALNLAIAQPNSDGTFVTRGWWIIGANHCASVIREELGNQYIYV